MSELTAPVVLKNDEQRIVYGPVLIPDEPDTDGDVVSAQKIEQVAHEFNEKYGNIDLQHSLNNVGRVVESYIAPVDLDFGNVVIPKGSWMMGVRVTDDHAWNLVKQGKLTGFSIMGVRSATVQKAAEEDVALKRTTLRDLGEDWIVNAVSLVDEPAVPKAKFLVIKSKNKDESNLLIKMKKLFVGNDNSQPTQPIDDQANKGRAEMDKQEIYEYVKSAVSESLEHFFNQLAQKDQNEPKQEDNTPDDVVVLSKQEYETLINRINEIESLVGKARDFGLFFNSRKLIGQDVMPNQKSKPEERPDRDMFGRKIYYKD